MTDLAELAKARRNVKRMIDGGASEAEIDSYLEGAGVTAEQLRSKKAALDAAERASGAMQLTPEQQAYAARGHEAALTGGVKVGPALTRQSVEEEAAERGTGARFMAGVGGAADRAAFALKDLFTTLSPQEQERIAQGRMMQEATTAGRLGGVAGNVAMTAPLYGATGGLAAGAGLGLGAQMGVAGATGAAAGAVLSPENRGREALLQGAGGALGAGLVGGLARAATPTLTPEMTRALKAGFKLTPSQLDRGTTLRALQGLSGSAKMEKQASIHNEKIGTQLIAKDLGLPISKKIVEADFSALRAKAGAVYDEVKNAIPGMHPDAQFRRDLAALKGDFTQAAQTYPGLMQNKEVEKLVKILDRPAPTRAMVELTRKLRSDARANLRAMDDPAKVELGMAQRGAATALEDLIERSVVAKPDLVERWRTARATIAKSHDAQAAFNPQTGQFASATLDRMMKRGRPLTGGLREVAEFHRAFGGSARNVETMRDVTSFSYGDYLPGGAGLLGGLAAGSPHVSLGGLGLMVARPATRHLLLNRPLASAGIRLGDIGGAIGHAGPVRLITPALTAQALRPESE